MNVPYSSKVVCQSLRDLIPTYDTSIQVVFLDAEELDLTESDHQNLTESLHKLIDRPLIPDVLVRHCSRPADLLFSNWKLELISESKFKSTLKPLERLVFIRDDEI